MQFACAVVICLLGASSPIASSLCRSRHAQSGTFVNRADRPKDSFRFSEFVIDGRAKSPSYPSPSRLTEGRLEIVADARRDAVDAEALLTNGAEADGEGVWSWHRGAGVKSCEKMRKATVAKEPFTGEITL